MSGVTATSNLFLNNAEDLVERLSRVEGRAAAELVVEARALVATFRSWASQRPADAARVAAIQRLFDVNRRAMDLLTSAGVTPPSSSPRPVSDDDGPRSASSSSRRRSA